jgi:hypothetical protein
MFTETLQSISATELFRKRQAGWGLLSVESFAPASGRDPLIYGVIELPYDGNIFPVELT